LKNKSLLNFDSPIRHFLVWVVLVGGLWSYWHINDILNAPPQANHLWRQADGASQALNLWHDGFPFPQTRVHNAVKGSGKTVGEFPLFYGIAALFYPIFGDANWILRGVHAACWLFGLFALGRIVWYWTRHVFMSLYLPLFLVSSPLVLFYAINYLPNVPVIGLLFIASFCFQQYFLHSSKRFKIAEIATKRWFWAFQILFAIIGIIKPTALILWIALAVLWWLEVLRGGQAFGRRALQFGGSWLLVVVVFVLWRWWSSIYNATHQTTGFFLATTMPIWNLDAADRLMIFRLIRDYWILDAFPKTTWLFIIISLCINIFFSSLQSLFWSGLLWLVGFGTVAFILLWYAQLGVHDYYFIDILPFISLILLSLFIVLQTKTSLLKNNIVQNIFITILSLVLLNNVIETKNILWKKRYNVHHAIHQDRPFPPLAKEKVRRFLDSVGVRKRDTVLSLSDGSPNASLYFFDRVGYTLWNIGAGGGAVRPSWVREKVRRQHAKYLILSRLNERNLDSIRPILPKPLAVYDSIFYIYDIQKF
jgi:hypothetical protein